MIRRFGVITWRCCSGQKIWVRFLGQTSKSFPQSPNVSTLMNACLFFRFVTSGASIRRRVRSAPSRLASTQFNRPMLEVPWREQFQRTTKRSRSERLRYHLHSKTWRSSAVDPNIRHWEDALPLGRTPDTSRRGTRRPN